MWNSFNFAKNIHFKRTLIWFGSRKHSQLFIKTFWAQFFFYNNVYYNVICRPTVLDSRHRNTILERNINIRLIVWFSLVGQVDFITDKWFCKSTCSSDKWIILRNSSTVTISLIWLIMVHITVITYHLIQELIRHYIFHTTDALCETMFKWNNSQRFSVSTYNHGEKICERNP